MAKMDKNQIVAMIKKVMVEEFEIDEAAITPEANLFTDLDLDSIDAVDLAVRLQQQTGKKVSPEDFKAIRTFQDVVDAADKLVNG